MLPATGITFISTFEKSRSWAITGIAAITSTSPARSRTHVALVMGIPPGIDIRNRAGTLTRLGLAAASHAQHLAGQAPQELAHGRELGGDEAQHGDAHVGEELGEEGA